MEKKNIVKFSNFLEKKKSDLKPFDKSDFAELLNPVKETKETKVDSKQLPQSPKVPFKNPLTKKVDSEPIQPKKILEEPKKDEVFDPPVDIEDFVYDNETPSELKIDDSLPETEYKIKEVRENYYTVYKDKFENFSCNVFVEGAKLDKTKARLVLESDDWNLIFEGYIDEFGKCQIPIKKLDILDEGLVGKIRLEVIAENTIFVPWEDDFKVKMNKKVEVELPKRKLPKETSVKVDFSK